MPNHPTVLLPLLVTCNACEGQGYIRTEADGVCRCHECHDGLRSIALPLHEVLLAAGLDHRLAAFEAALWHNLQAVVERLGPRPRHPLMYTVVDVPSAFTDPLWSSKPKG